MVKASLHHLTSCESFDREILDKLEAAAERRRGIGMGQPSGDSDVAPFVAALARMLSHATAVGAVVSSGALLGAEPYIGAGRGAKCCARRLLGQGALLRTVAGALADENADGATVDDGEIIAFAAAEWQFRDIIGESMQPSPRQHGSDPQDASMTSETGAMSKPIGAQSSAQKVQGGDIDGADWIAKLSDGISFAALAKHAEQTLMKA